MTEDNLILRYEGLKKLLAGMERRRKVLAVEVDNVEQLKKRIDQLKLDVPEKTMNVIEAYGKKITGAKDDIAKIDDFLMQRVKVLQADVKKAKAKIKASMKAAGNGQ